MLLHGFFYRFLIISGFQVQHGIQCIYLKEIPVCSGGWTGTLIVIDPIIVFAFRSRDRVLENRFCGQNIPYNPMIEIPSWCIRIIYYQHQALGVRWDMFN